MVLSAREGHGGTGAECRGRDPHLAVRKYPRHCEVPLTNPCEVNPDFWFSESPAEVTRAKETCSFCPVRAECAELGEGEEFGIWGGRSPEDRRSDQRFRVIMLEELVSSRIKNMTAEGMSISAMARELGIPRKTLADRLRRMTALVA